MEEFKNSKLILQMDEEQLHYFLDKFYQKIQAQWQRPLEFVDEKTALQTLGLKSKTSLWKLRSEGKISYSKMGRIILYRYSSLMDFIQENELKKF